MSLQKKTMSVVALTVGISILVLYLASDAIVLGSFSGLESDEAQQNVQRVRSALDDDLITLEGTTRDWSLWDDTYQYVTDHNDEYFNSNLANNLAMFSNRLNVMLFIDKQGSVVAARAADYRDTSPAAFPESLLEQVVPDSPLLQHPEADSSIKGIIALPEGAMLIASEPIMHSTGSGDIDGTLIFGRFLDTDAVQHLAKAPLIGLSLQPLSALPFADDPGEPAPTLSTDAPLQISPRSDSQLDAYYLLNDVFGKPALILEAQMPRLVYQRGMQTLQYYLFTLLGVALVWGVVVVLLLQRLVLSRVARLKHDVSAISLSSDPSARVAASGSDELSGLAMSINGMLAVLHSSREEQREGEERYRAVVEQTRDAIFLVDAVTGQFIEANAAFQSLLGYSFDELATLHLPDVVDADGDKTGLLSRDTTGLLRLAVERKYIRKDGSVVPVEVSDTRITYGGRQALCIVARDITDRKRAEAALRELARRDGLTGLYNRREMQRILQEQVELHARSGQPLSFILLDIDHFKTVNDSYGHQVGDAVLRWMGLLIPQLVRQTDWVARYGGEELAVILPGTSIEAAYEMAERLRTLLAEQLFEFTRDWIPFRDLDHEPSAPNETLKLSNEGEPELLIPITVSLGVSALSDDINSDEILVYSADKALYAAKRSGRNCTVTCAMLAPKLRIVASQG
jgi:diguanylate cyclase (GGDEF)-like protein/PAS domain S-box-containing protein